jgi:serine/threonine-protein kinase HipA
MTKCLGCYQKIEDAEASTYYHKSCSKKLFGTEAPPVIEFSAQDLAELAKKSIAQHLGITGVQPKISLHIEKNKNDPNHRLMIVGLWGNFILKPPTQKFPDISVVEDLTMHLAELVGIKTAKHGLIKLNSGELSYLTQRFDRTKNGEKIAVEDFCQLSELLTESKYDTSSEKAGKIILKYSSQPGLDAVSFFDLNLFSFLTGNSDMHLKNFSLTRTEQGQVTLSPAYDLVSTKILFAEDKEEMALTVNGKKAKLKKTDFIALGKNLKIADKAIDNSFVRVTRQMPLMKKLIKQSYLSDALQKKFIAVIDDRRKVLSL